MLTVLEQLKMLVMLALFEVGGATRWFWKPKELTHIAASNLQIRTFFLRLASKKTTAVFANLPPSTLINPTKKRSLEQPVLSGSTVNLVRAQAVRFGYGMHLTLVCAVPAAR